MNWTVGRTGGLAVGAALLSLSGGPPARRSLPACDGSAGLTLPEGFCAVVVADQVGAARHLTVAPNGDVFVAIAGGRSGSGGVLALRDTSGDGKADVRQTFGTEGGTGIALGKGVLYASTSSTVYRYAMRAGSLTPLGAPDVIVKDLPIGGHSAKNLALSPDGRTLFVNFGSATNSCQVKDRSAESPGEDPCSELAYRAGVWRFDATKLDQNRLSGTRFATGIRNAVGLAFAPSGELYATQHGRDQLGQNWSKLFTIEQSAEKPSEEFFKLTEGADFGWPYCYHDAELGHLVLAPEYGGDGKQVGRCKDKQEPLVAFPGHWAPDGLAFYAGTQFPERYRGGAFIAFHGSWNRAPLPQAGYRVAFVPFKNGKPVGGYETFADGFWKEDPAGPKHRPVGVAVGPDGSLYITDDAGGTIWRVMYKGR